MRKFIVAGAAAGVAVLGAGCSGSNVGQVHSLQTKVSSLQSDLASAQRHISQLRRDLTKELSDTIVKVQAAEEENASRMAALKTMEDRLKREQSSAGSVHRTS